MIEQVDTYWHDINDRPDLGEGVRVGRLGSISHLIDGKGRAISDGYHELYLTQEEKTTGIFKRVRVHKNKEIWGSYGAKNEIVHIKSYKDVKSKFKMVAENIEETVQLLTARVEELENEREFSRY